MAREDALVWIDLEMTGLEPETCTILEIGTLVTDSQLNLLAEGPNLVIHQSEEALSVMDEWNQQHHGASGLTRQVRESTITTAEAEQQTLSFLRTYVVENTAPLCGNSIWQDRRFLARYMPRLEAFLHYRVIDVSSIKEVVRRWYPSSYAPPRKESAHRALDDIRQSIEELRYYRKHVFVDSESGR